MNDNSDFIFWGFLGVIIGVLFGYNNGCAHQKKICDDQRRDLEMEDLKRQIIALKAKINY